MQTSSESTTLYFHHKVSLGLEAEVSFDTIKEELLVGLISTELVRHLRVRDPQDPDEIATDIRGFEELERCRSQAASLKVKNLPKPASKTDRPTDRPIDVSISKKPKK